MLAVSCWLVVDLCDALSCTWRGSGELAGRCGAPQAGCGRMAEQQAQCRFAWLASVPHLASEVFPPDVYFLLAMCAAGGGAGPH